MELIDRYRGAMLGLAVGDALGTTLEFKPPGSFELITDMVGGGPFDLKPGKWTDDTSMALCLAQSLIEKQGFDPDDQMQRYVRWYREGYMSSTGTCFDIGNTVSAALRKFELTGEPYAGETDLMYGGNGSLMRLVPIPLAYASTPMNAMALAGAMSRTTHGSPEPIDACRYYTGLIIGVLQGQSKETILSARYRPVECWADGDLTPKVDIIASGSFKEKEPPAIRGTGYVIEALEAALWAFLNSESYEEGALMAVNLGDDADTTGAIYGQLAGVYYGVESIPANWQNQIANRLDIVQLSDALFKLSGKI